MVYNVVAQADHDAASNASDSDASRSSSPQNHQTNDFYQVPLHTDNAGGRDHMKPASSHDDSSLRRLGSMIRSMTDTSYDIVEDDDYETVDPSGRPNSLQRATLPNFDSYLHSTPPDPPLRCASSDHPVPLSHPMPDLQSFQGAYAGNVERLERSAECLSSSSADIGSEIRKMDLEQKRRSYSSASNSNSIMRSASGSQLAQISEPGHEQSYGHLIDRVRNAPMLPPVEIPVHIQHEFAQHDFSHVGQTDVAVGEGQIERPSSAASNDTFQQARALFTDFDGVHFVSHDNGSEPTRNVSLTKPPLATGSEPHKEPQTGENMVYYPAPVPMMLNLPPRLSRKPISEREKRRTQLLSSVPVENRKSAPWLTEQDQEEGNDRQSKPATDMPPHLRASVFFEQPAVPVDVEVKQSSAVATLDSILDASARAPVSAFTDHPFAGHLGSEVYGKSKSKSASKVLAEQKKKDRSRNTLVSNRHTLPPGPNESTATVNALPKQPETEAPDVHETTALRSDSDRDRVHDDSNSEEHHSESNDDGEESEYSDEEPEYVGQPNTLLAELQLRKQELKQRRRTAANSVGLHTTLLELDAVAQKQSEHRRQKRVTLAWEAPDLNKHEDEENEDVPLAMLYPEKANQSEETRPLGLMEKRELEESEPLSRRRARLRGEAPIDPPPGLRTRPSTMAFQPTDEAAEPESENEGETLGQRLKRMKAKDRNSAAVESEFTAEVLAELNHLNGDDEKEEEKEKQKEKEKKVLPEEETLAQRRARLQGETKTQRGMNPTANTARKSMVNLSQARPVTGSLQPSFDPAPYRSSMDPRLYGNRMSMYQAPSHFGNMPPQAAGFSQHPGYAMANPYGYTANHPNTFYSDAILGMNNLAYTMSGSYYKEPKPVIDPGQREMIDRWRQSIK
ncbi:hypothetical protein PHISCL_09285 [Aspergillus sclerotialis]|uniref:Uncharacterized protein n=1 Tax=Aspergillus sclerotialis TaxID=2070753 RepID=A0A3A2ZKH3_9EURO|nr:hypothetical protein PHISCL_09285 [Aspergillus sclerotialis]